MREDYDYIVVGGGASGCVVAAKLVNEGGARVLLLEAGNSHRHPLLDMPPGIFKMINGSKYMRYHKTVPQEQSIAFEKKCREAGVPCDLVLIPKAGHRLREWRENDAAYQQKLVTWLTEKFSPTAATQPPAKP